ncbi:hypothetical protein [Prosthecobacter vanneervenii]|uniref:Uncharacterized protein n=1 Tax=Prosthecobacter vanneervenii TaxID=48466 RepID=A0A7W7Y6J4_9BACT|nr:hypothetical protein [Prosthecobacter vanneervenii]MBB5030519.1 hypothetical protein [Prosthecobacter vanneervenii]
MCTLFWIAAGLIMLASRSNNQHSGACAYKNPACFFKVAAFFRMIRLLKISPPFSNASPLILKRWNFQVKGGPECQPRWLASSHPLLTRSFSPVCHPEYVAGMILAA